MSSSTMSTLQRKLTKNSTVAISTAEIFDWTAQHNVLTVRKATEEDSVEAAEVDSVANPETQATLM